MLTEEQGRDLVERYLQDWHEAWASVREDRDSVRPGVLDTAGTLAFVALVAFFTVRALVRVNRARAELGRVLADAIIVRTRGHVVVAVSPTQASPFAAWLHGRAWVVLDIDTFANRDQRFLALRHELTHHRHGDARLASVLELLTGLLGPLGRAWHRLLRIYEELACDGAVVDAGVDVGAYAACLLDVARRSTSAAPSLLTPLADETHILEKRILSMTANHAPSRTRFTTLGIGLAGLATMGLLACSAAESDLQSHRDEAVATTAQKVATPRGATHAGSVFVELTGDGAMRVDGATVANDDELARRALAARDENADVRGVVRADASVPHDRVIAVLDRLRDARVQRITFGLRVD